LFCEDAGVAITLMDFVGEMLHDHGLDGTETLTLAEAGMDSLSLVELLDRLEPFGDGAEPEPSYALADGGVLQRLSIAELVAIAEAIDQTGDVRKVLEPYVAVHGDEARQAVEAMMRRDSQLDAEERYEPAAELGPTVLMTGATGFVGPFLLASLIGRSDWTIYCLTRAIDAATAQGRLESSLRTAGLLSPTIEEALSSRVIALPGDLSQANCGLAPEVWERLATEVSTVVHNGASVDYVRTYEALRPHNVDGTKEMLRFCRTGRPKNLQYISSTIIFGWTALRRLYEDDSNTEMVNLDFGYAQTKWVAEQLVRQARDRGLTSTIFRPSFLTASTEGFGDPTDIVARLLSFMIRHGIAPTAGNQVSFLPVDVAMDTVAAIMTQGNAHGETLHVTVDDYYNIGHVMSEIADRYGYPMSLIDTEAFVGALRRRCGQADPMYPLLEFVVRSYKKLLKMEQKRYDNSTYRNVRAGALPDYREPLLGQTAQSLVEFLVTQKLVDPPMVASSVG
jgi:thioester reductase-like protein